MTDNATSLYVLHECAAGYVLFEVVAFEEIGSLLEDNDTVTDLKRFGRACKLKSFHPFESAEEALENINAVSEHAVTDTLTSFLEMNLPSLKSSSEGSVKKKKRKSNGGEEGSVVLGVIDSGLATAISNAPSLSSSLTCRSDDTVREILRGVRLHLPTFIQGLSSSNLQQAQLGLGHSYSRTKVKFNPARSDNMIIQSIALLDQMDKDLNTFSMRIKEWYSWHFPELQDLVKDMYMYARCAALIQDKTSLRAKVSTADGSDDEENDEDKDNQQDGNEKVKGLEEILGDEDLAQAVVAAARSSMGMDCSIVDMVNIVNFSQRMMKLAEYRKQLALYLTDKMKIVAPNLQAILGDTVAARLISKAGSLTNLAKAPASTVQILGAEKALFRALKTKGNTPKYGLIYHSTFIGRADAKNKGRISRYLANKCSIATRIDSFSDEPTSAYGEMLRDQVEERLKFYETGAAPRKNVDVMEEVARQLEKGNATDGHDNEKQKRKKKSDENVEVEKMDIDDSGESDKATKKAAKKAAKKRKKESLSPMKVDEEQNNSVLEDKAMKKAAKKAKKKAVTPSKEREELVATPASEKSQEKSHKKKKKKKSKD